MLKHEPETPCRPSIYGEGIYLEHWQRFMSTTPKFGDGDPDEQFDSIYGPRLYVDLGDACDPDERRRAQRAATVAASFIVWLGTNCGRAMITHAGEWRAKLPDGEKYEAMAIVWMQQNRRRAGLNGMRTVAEAIVKTPDAIDLEVMAVTADWLGTSEGLAFIAAAEREIEVTQLSLRDHNAMIARATARAADLKARGLAV